MTNNAFTQIDVTDIVGHLPVIIDPAKSLSVYFGRLVDTIFNRPVEYSRSEKVEFTKTEIRQMYKRAYPKAKV